MDPLASNCLIIMSQGACLALNAGKWYERVGEICIFHELPRPSLDEKIPVGTGSNPVSSRLTILHGVQEIIFVPSYVRLLVFYGNLRRILILVYFFWNKVMLKQSVFSFSSNLPHGLRRTKMLKEKSNKFCRFICVDLWYTKHRY